MNTLCYKYLLPSSVILLGIGGGVLATRNNLLSNNKYTNIIGSGVAITLSLYFFHRLRI